MIKIFLRIIFILLITHIILGDDDEHCKKWGGDSEDGYWCKECENGYYLENDECHKNLCVEGEEEDSCEMCNIKEGRWISCNSDNYSVYERYKCKKSSLTCGNNTINNCEKCEIVDGNETGFCEKCYTEYLKLNNTICKYIFKNDCKTVKVNKYLIYFMILILLLSN